MELGCHNLKFDDVSSRLECEVADAESPMRRGGRRSMSEGSDRHGLVSSRLECELVEVEAESPMRREGRR